MVAKGSTQREGLGGLANRFVQLLLCYLSYLSLVQQR